MPGYWQRPDETARAIRDGWLYTGDVAQMDEEGYVFIVDRKKDMILVSGFNVYPNEVESVIATHPGVQDCAVVGVPDEDTGEWVVAYVIRKDRGVTVDMIRDHCRQSLTGYKVPKLVIFRDELPKSPVGKVLRKDLREDAADARIEYGRQSSIINGQPLPHSHRSRPGQSRPRPHHQLWDERR